MLTCYRLQQFQRGLGGVVAELRPWKATCATRPQSRGAMKGIRFLFHVAARLPALGPQAGRNFGEQPRGDTSSHASGARGGGERVVYTSSVATIACAANGGQADETMRLSQSSALGAYKQSKVADRQSMRHLRGSEPRVRPLAHQAHKPASFRTAGRARRWGRASQRRGRSAARRCLSNNRPRARGSRSCPGNSGR